MLSGKTNGIHELQALNTKTAACQATRKSHPSEWKSVLHVLSVSEPSAADKKRLGLGRDLTS